MEGRDLEILRIGDPAAPKRVLLRSRAHPWEPGGNWVIEGLIERLLRGDEDAREYLSRYCVYVLPIANKDGVARGRTRFNMLGSDLNRQWDRPADPGLAPENHALESWLEGLIASGKKPDLAIDFHNDNSGFLHVSRSVDDDTGQYVADMRRLEQLLRTHVVHRRVDGQHVSQSRHDWRGTAAALWHRGLRSRIERQLDCRTQRLSHGRQLATVRPTAM